MTNRSTYAILPADKVKDAAQKVIDRIHEKRKKIFEGEVAYYVRPRRFFKNKTTREEAERLVMTDNIFGPESSYYAWGTLVAAEQLVNLANAAMKEDGKVYISKEDFNMIEGYYE